MWKNQSGKFTTNKMVNVDLLLPWFSATEFVTWKCHMDDSDVGIYGIILGRDLPTALGVDKIFQAHHYQRLWII